MREMIEALVTELKQLKRHGEAHVLLAPDRLGDLEDAVAHLKLDAPVESTPDRSSTDAEERPRLEVTPRESGPSIFEQMVNAKPAPISSGSEQTPAAATDTVRTLPAPPQLEIPDGTPSERLAWLKQRVLDCPICQKHTPEGKQIVFGVGDPEADLFLCGEAPGAEETVQGEPFVGPAGQLLDKIMATAGWKREDLYIGNIMNWRPDTGRKFGNRPPTDEELNFCLPYLRAQVAIVQPKVILALGKTAVKGLLYGEENFSLGRVHGQWHQFDGIDVMPTYHPSYLLHNQSNRAKRMVWEDVMKVMEKLGKPISERQRGFFL